MGEYFAKMINLCKLEWDTSFFGVDSYKIVVDDNSVLEDLLKCVSEFKQKSFVTIINQDNDSVVNKKITNMFNGEIFLTDVNISFKKNIDLSSNCVKEEFQNQIVCTNNYLWDDDIVSIADSFLYSRFFNDTNLGEKRNDIYTNWVRNSFGQSNKYFIALKKDLSTVGFILFSYSNQREITIELIAVDSNMRNEKIGSKMMQYLFSYCGEKSIDTINVGTQVSNVNALNFYFKNGFEVNHVNSIYHLWTNGVDR